MKPKPCLARLTRATTNGPRSALWFRQLHISAKVEGLTSLQASSSSFFPGTTLHLREILLSTHQKGPASSLIVKSIRDSFSLPVFCAPFLFTGLAHGRRVHARMSGSRYDYIRVPTAYNNVGFEANDLVDYGGYNGSLQRSLSGFSDDTASLGSPTTYELSPSLDTFNYNFDSTHYSSRQLPTPRSTSTTTSGTYTAHWPDATSSRYKNTYNSQPAATGSLSIQPSR